MFIGFEKSPELKKDFLSCILRQLCEIPSFITMELLFQNFMVLFSFSIYLLHEVPCVKKPQWTSQNITCHFSPSVKEILCQECPYKFPPLPVRQAGGFLEDKDQGVWRGPVVNTVFSVR